MNNKYSAEELLKKLMECFYSGTDGVMWSYIESVTIRSVLGRKIEDELKKYMNEEEQ